LSNNEGFTSFMSLTSLTTVSRKTRNF